MADGSLIFDTRINASGFTKGLEGLKGLASKGISGISKLMNGVTQSVTAASAALGGLGAYATSVGSSFQGSMSQVAATMGMTTEEINNGSEAFEKLKQAAKDAGASTQFSATEAGDALNYLALAGFNADEACEALPTVLNLAAAGGMDLASASDMVTDSMAALGLSLDQMTNFSDQLAKTAQKSNTSVSQLGQAILTVGGTAKGLAGGTTELNTALGLLANVGIKGAEGGTALRNVITSLSAPTDKAAGLLKTLGVEVLDASGNMRPLNEIMKDLDKSLQGLGEGEKARILSNIFNKEDLKAVSGLMSQSGQAWDDLAAQIANADGACQNMADTMNDNLQGDIKTLQSALEAFGIEVYESLDAPLRETAQKATESLRDLTNAFKENGFSGLAEALGSELSNWIKTISSYLPKAVELGVSVIKSLVSGIIDNLPSISDSALKIGMTLVEGIKDIVPDLAMAGADIIINLCQGMTDNIDTIISVGTTIVSSLWDAICTSAPVIADSALVILQHLCKGIGQALPNLIPVALDVILGLCEYIIDNLDIVIDCAFDIIDGLVDGITKALPNLLDEAPIIIQEFCDKLVDNLPKIVKAAVEIVAKLAWAIITNLPKIAKCSLQIINTLKNGLIDSAKELGKAGLELMGNLKDSILSIDWFAVGKKIIDLIKDGITGNGNILQTVIDAALGKDSTPKDGHGGDTGDLSNSGTTNRDRRKNTRTAQNVLNSFKNATKNTAQKISSDQDSMIDMANNTLDKAKKLLEDNVKDKTKNASTNNTNVDDSVGRAALASLEKTKKTKAKKEQEIIDGTARYAALEQEAEIKRSDEYLKLSKNLSKKEQEQIEADLNEKEKIGLRGIQEKYNAWLNAEKTAIENKQKQIDAVEKKIKKQSDALTIAQQTKDLKGAYKVLASLEVELTEGLDAKTKAQKLKDIQNRTSEVTQSELDALEEANTAKLELQKQGLEDEKSLMESYKSNYSKTYDDMVKAYESAYNTIMSKQSKLEDKFKAYGELYDTFKAKDAEGNEKEYMQLGDIADDILQLKTFGEALETLRGKGASSEFLEEIANMDTGKAMDFTELLLKQSDANLQAYMANWEEKQKLSKELSQNFYAGEVDKLKEDFSGKVKDELGIVADDATQKGQDTASNFVQGFLSKKDEVKAAINAFWQEVRGNSMQTEALTIAQSGNVAKQVAASKQTNTDNTGITAAIGTLANALAEGKTEEKATVILDGRKVGESTTVVDGVLRELKRRGIDINAR